MAIPKQVKDQAAAIEKFYADNQEGATPTEIIVDATDLNPVTPPAQDLPPATTVVVGSPAPASQVVTPIEQPDSELARVKHQYATLQGMFNSTDARLREALGQIDQLRYAIQNVQTVPTTPIVKAPVASPVTEQEMKEYTPAFFEMMDRYMGSRLNPLAAQVQDLTQQVPAAVNTLSNQVGQVSQAQYKTAEQQFFGELRGRVPDWEQTNNSPTYHEWLAVIDPLTGISRQVYLDDARKRMDLDRVVSIFNSFKQPSASVGTVSTLSTNKSELAVQAVVQSRHSTQPNTDAGADDQKFTKADLKKLYDDYRIGKYKGKEAEFKANEAELLKAISENRYYG